MSGKLTTAPQPQPREESEAATASDEEKETTSSTFSLSCSIPQDGIHHFKRSSSPAVIDCNVSQAHVNGTGGQIRCAPQHEDECRPSPSADAPSFSTFEHAEIKFATPPSSCTSTGRNRKNLMVLIQIMLKYLDNNDRKLRVEVKKAVADCTKKNREGHPDYRFLVDSITRRLRLVVGDMHWSQLENLMDHYRKNPDRGRSRSSDSVPKFVAV
mmetsp:Transcript_28577/g.40811  ORF Transcript_28577/g.40811 Transcript_28577/m.40811 type:complete len:213 (+) Transcript_28577:207-845(+)|eukprot:CAMPEP_0201710812 /NCGR_PEP_ID=MMETSP0578-20130828/58818_1 /ASSEMBLY_ACC=CAM_ASM_000663 /TAXON_ID=267565 /ORGANISM="Skeletonema grethea, Strain CCMP 1804" /LENGTH=212 /DNA_ID=CAMNT_0048199845 /DNA_START=126 /DNA_END=764 /DNA_ORIENTATION=+